MLWFHGGSLPHRTLAAATACVALLTATASTASGAPKEPLGCPTGFGPALTLEQAIQLPLFQEGLEAGLFTEADLAAGFASFDINGNGLLCFKHPKGFVLPHPYIIFDELPANDG
jgi:hypothetical protein